MANLIHRGLLQSRVPLVDIKRFRGKINIQRPRQPHYERARVIAVTTPEYVPKPINQNCFKESPYKLKTKIANPYNDIIAREVFNWFDQSKMIAIFHQNSITADDLFKIRVKLFRENMHLKTYGLAILKKAVENTKFEATLPLFCSHHCLVFSSEQKMSKLLRLTKKSPQLILMGGIVENRLMNKNELVNYAAMPSLEVVQAQLVSVLNSAAGQIVNNLESHQKMLVNMLDVHAKSSLAGTEKDSEESTSNSPKVEPESN